MGEQVCQGGPTLIFACSGAADVGQIADLAARKLMRDGVGQMFCLAGVGGRVEPILKKTAGASQILAIDGCGLDCVKATLEQAGFERFIHFRVTDMGLEKGQSSPDEAKAEMVATEGRSRLAQDPGRSTT